MRRNISIMSGLGPPPPSPHPNGMRLRVARPRSAKLRTEKSSSTGWMIALYVSTGGKWVNTVDPSIPSHQNVWCGKRLVRFQLSFCVRNRSMPAWDMIPGSEAG